MDILRRYNRGESTATIRKILNLSESMLRTIKEGHGEDYGSSESRSRKWFNESVVRPVQHHGQDGENVGRLDGP